jgi:hypothetical protein
MNLQKIKFALVAGLINQAGAENPMVIIRKMMEGFAGDVGTYLGLASSTTASSYEPGLRQSYALSYERCTLRVDVIASPDRRQLVVQDFRLDRP